MSQPLMDPRWLFVCVFFCFLEGFCNFWPQFPKKQTHGFHEWLTHVYSVTSHGYHTDVHFFGCFSHGLGKFSTHGLGTLPESYLKPWRKYNTAKTWKYNQQTSFSMAFEVCFQINILQYMPCAASSFSPRIWVQPPCIRSAAFIWNESKVIFKETAVQRNPLSTFLVWLWSSLKNVLVEVCAKLPWYGCEPFDWNTCNNRKKHDCEVEVYVYNIFGEETWLHVLQKALPYEWNNWTNHHF